MNGLLNKIILSFTLKGQQDKRLQDYRKYKEIYLSLSCEGLIAERIYLEVKYTAYKSYVLLYSISIILSLFTQIWSKFVKSFIYLINNYYSSNIEEKLAREISFLVSVIIISLVFIMLTLLLYKLLSNLQEIHKKLKIIDSLE